MDIISSLNSSRVTSTEQRPTAESVRQTEENARVIAGRIGAAGGTDSFFSANTLVSRLRDTQAQANDIQDRISRLQTEQTALTDIRDVLAQNPADAGARVAEIARNARYNGEPVVATEPRQLMQDRAVSQQTITERLDQLSRDFSDLTGDLTSLLVRTENLMASSGPALQGNEVSGAIAGIRNALQGGAAPLSLNPDGVKPLL